MIPTGRLDKEFLSAIKEDKVLLYEASWPKFNRSLQPVSAHRAMPADESLVVVAAGKYIEEGFDELCFGYHPADDVMM